MIARRIVITGMFFLMVQLCISILARVLGFIWNPLYWITVPIGMYLGWRMYDVWRWTNVQIDNSFYCAAEMHLQCDAVMGCACTCHKEEWDG